ncbi:MAG: pirin family protein [Leptospiraceae bacterium]|nr:pirin family protein [Leptospiraceae bacterium]
MKTLFRAIERGVSNHGWLLSYHTFSFSHYFNPEKMGFGRLRVLNDDTVKPGFGFGTHPHENMEIVSIPLAGAIGHKDSTGTNGSIHVGEVQIMSAGTGITHSEFNHSSQEELKFLQVWILPEKINIAPRYDQKSFPKDSFQENWKLVVSPKSENDTIWINQNSFFSLGNFSNGKKISYKLYDPSNSVFLFLIEGSILVDGEVLDRRDGIGLSGNIEYSIEVKADANLLAIEVPK